MVAGGIGGADFKLGHYRSSGLVARVTLGVVFGLNGGTKTTPP